MGLDKDDLTRASELRGQKASDLDKIQLELQEVYEENQKKIKKNHRARN